jgi:hypothetical protein
VEQAIIGEVLDAEDNIQGHVEYVRNNLEAVIMLPGCGEESLSDLTVLDQLLQDFPNLKTVGIISSWFIDSTDIAHAKIKPGVENSEGTPWKVGGYTREDAHQITMRETNGEKIVNYGGTVSDDKLLAWVNKANELGLEVAFYPLIMVDNPAKTWRGYITGSPEDVAKFYKEQYKPFIIHYANLLKGRVKIFYIGSELEGLTSIKDEQNHFPFVHKMISLAPKVEKIFADEKVSDNPKKDTLLSYAANWTEYHSYRGGFRPLDNLWSHPTIDFVGIDYYMPLTNEQDKDLHNVETIKKGFYSGEGKDFYIEQGEKVLFQGQSWAWKNIKHWWESEHWDWDGKKNNKTNWRVLSKPIVFSEFGIPSVDRATDTPYLYGQNLSPNSNVKVDNQLQVIAIRAFLEHIKESNFIRTGFCYGYDSRGKGWYKRYTDGNDYATGHWIDGKWVNNENNA